MKHFRPYPHESVRILSIIILDARFSNAPTWPLVIYDSICVDNHELIIQFWLSNLTFV